MENDIIVIAHNLRSCNNVGSILRTAEGLGVKTVYLTGYTPYPSEKNDIRLPYIREKLDKKIIKTSLGAERLVKWQHDENIFNVINHLKKNNYEILALEQNENSIELQDFKAKNKVTFILGREVEGIENDVLEIVDQIISIPMLGKKESFNVAQAMAMMTFKLRYYN